MVLGAKDSRTAALTIALLVAVVAASLPALAKTRAPVSASDLPLIKAAMVYNICKFVEWPEERSGSDAFVVGVFGHEDGDPAFESVADKTMRDRPLRFVEVRDSESLAACHVLYVSPGAAADWPELREAATAHSVLTISDIEEFAEQGGIVALEYESERLRFSINKAAARHGRLRFSSQVLKIAKSVLDDD